MKARSPKEQGQALVIFTLALIAFLAILALAVDGGNTYLRKRIAQTAADAGALAGAREYCVTNDTVAAFNVAQEYAVTRNEVDSAVVNIDTATNTVDVTTHVTFNTFVAYLIGRNQMAVEASAEAQCMNPTSGEGILPVAWSCRPPVAGPPPPPGECDMDNITLDELDNYIANPPPEGTIYPELYISMDSRKTSEDVYCWPDGTLICDLDGDGDNDLMADGGRSWLDLDGGGGGAVELRDWIENGFDPPVGIHIWFPDQSGVANSVFQSAATRVGDIVLIPVFTSFCEGDPTTECPGAYHGGDDTVVWTSSSSARYFHVETFAAFYVSCVDAPGVPGSCPGHDVAVDMGSIPANTKTIEGYFIEGFIPGLGGSGGGGLDTGAYVLLLTR